MSVPDTQYQALKTNSIKGKHRPVFSHHCGLELQDPPASIVAHFQFWPAACHFPRKMPLLLPNLTTIERKTQILDEDENSRFLLI